MGWWTSLKRGASSVVDAGGDILGGAAGVVSDVAGGVGGFVGDVVGGVVGGVAGGVYDGVSGVIGSATGVISGGNASVGDPKESIYSDMAEASMANMALFTAGQLQQTRMQANMMNLMGQRMQQMEQGKLDTKLEIAKMNVTARMQEEQYRHDEKLLEQLNHHIEELVDDGMIDPDSLA